MPETPEEREARRAHRRLTETPEEREARHARYREARQRRRRQRRLKRLALYLPLALLAVAVAGFGVWELLDQPERPQQAVPVVQQTEDAEPPAVLFIGDSFAGGSAMSQGPTWPTQLARREGWVGVVNAVGGTGFARGSVLGESLENRLEDVLRRYEPDGVVVAMGLNDSTLPQDEVVEAARRALGAMRARWPDVPFVVLSPFSPKEIPAVTSLDEALRPLMIDLKLPYIQVTDAFDTRPELIGSDGTHPTDEGHAYLTDYIDERLDEIGFVDEVADQADDGM